MRKLPELANQKFAGVDQIKFTYADMHENMKVMIKSPLQRRYISQIHTENDIENILSLLECECERFSKIYPSGGSWWL